MKENLARWETEKSGQAYDVSRHVQGNFGFDCDIESIVNGDKDHLDDMQAKVRGELGSLQKEMDRMIRGLEDRNGVK
ncbi:MAG: hypothetical protein V3R86_07695 [Candidatus Hydrothermarchaeaceae archaeon]